VQKKFWHSERGESERIAEEEDGQSAMPLGNKQAH